MKKKVFRTTVALLIAVSLLMGCSKSVSGEGIVSELDSSKQSVTAIADSAKQSIATAEEAAKQSIQAAGDTAKQSIQTAGDTAKQSIQTAGDTAKQEIAAAADTAKQSVAGEAVSAKQSVVAEAETAKQYIQAEAETLMQSIAGELENLKAAESALAESTATSENEVQNGEPAVMTAETMRLYFYGLDKKEEMEHTVYFRNGNRQIVYYDMETVKFIMENIYNKGYGSFEADKNYSLNYKEEGSIVTFERENGSTMRIDFDRDTITFSDFDMFVSHSFDITPNDFSPTSGYNEKGEPVYFKRVKEKSYGRSGREYIFDLGAHHIDIPFTDGKCYIPAQTITDVLMLSTYNVYIYNTNNELYVEYEAAELLYDDKELQKIYFMNTDQAVPRSRELIDFTYNELCMVLDYEYGLKEIHHVRSFDEYIAELKCNGTSVKELILSDDIIKSEVGLCYLMNGGLDDLHSTYLKESVYYDYYRSNEIPDFNMGQATYKIYDEITRHTFARLQYAADEKGAVDCYKEVGNTAFVTFDMFSPCSRDYYENPEAKNDCADVFGIVQYAHEQITRPDSPIENVVLDLSINTGGDENALLYVCGWMLGEIPIALQDTLTDSGSVTYYMCDVNLDHEFDEKDNISSKNLYCLISPVSFSCGNAAPAILKESGRVTLIGRTSGGGSCIVLPMTTAQGDLIQTSGFRVMSEYKNGSFYDVDRGIAPDITLTHFESFYDREKLVEMINGLY